jgi:hypothetical protein
MPIKLRFLSLKAAISDAIVRSDRDVATTRNYDFVLHNVLLVAARAGVIFGLFEESTVHAALQHVFDGFLLATVALKLKVR